MTTRKQSEILDFYDSSEEPPRKRRLIDVPASVIGEVLFEIKLDDSAARARRLHPPPICEDRYRINVAKLESIGGHGLLLELQSSIILKPDTELLQEWPTEDFDVILYEDSDGYREVRYKTKGMEAWSLDMSHPNIHAVWTLFRCVGALVE